MRVVGDDVALAAPPDRASRLDRGYQFDRWVGETFAMRYLVGATRSLVVAGGPSFSALDVEDERRLCRGRWMQQK